MCRFTHQSYKDEWVEHKDASSNGIYISSCKSTGRVTLSTEDWDSCSEHVMEPEDAVKFLLKALRIARIARRYVK